MRLFLASDELSNPTGHGQLTRALVELAGPLTRIAVVANGRDGEPPRQRRERVAAEKASLEPLNAEVIELDLRDHVNGLRTDTTLTDTGLIWMTGGDMALLRGLVRSSGLDSVLRRRLDEDSIVYSGYSAGACLAGPALTAAELEGNQRAGDEIGWGGLGLVAVTIVPHVPPARAPDNDFMAIVKHLRGRGLPCQPLRDGQALVVAGARANLI